MSKTIELNIPCTAEERLKAEAESIWGLIRRISASASDGRYYHFEEEDREQAIDFLKKFARTFEPAQGQQPCGAWQPSAEAIAAVIDPVAFDPISLADTHPSWEWRRETARATAAEILALGPSVSSTMRASPISGSESCTCHFLGAGTHHIPGCVFYEAVSSFTSPESN